MKLNDAVNARIAELLEKNGMNQYQLFMKSGVPQSTLITIKKKKCKSARLDTIAAICIGFNLSLEEFFASPLFSKDEVVVD